MIDLLSKVVDSLAPSTTGSSGGEPGYSVTNNVATSPPRYYKWSIGKYGQTPSMNITNMANIG